MTAPKVDTRRACGPLVLKALSDTNVHSRTYYTHDDWYLEDGFLITFDVEGTKRAHKLPTTVHTIIEGKVKNDLDSVSG